MLILVNAFFAASEMALISLNDNKIRLMAQEGNPKAKLLQGLLEEPSRFLATIQIGITLAGFMASAFAAENFAGDLSALLVSLGVPVAVNILNTISLVVITLILSYVTLVLGELVPKRVAMKKADAIAMFVASPLNLLSKVAAPFVKLLTSSTNLLVRLFGVDPNENDEEVSEEEIRMMLDSGTQMGTIQAAEKLMINNIFDFDNKQVSDIMTHRTDIVAVSVLDTAEKVIRAAEKEGYSRFPVYENHMDNIVGILHTKDLIRFVNGGSGGAWNVRELARSPYFVPASKKTHELFEELQQNRVHFAVVVDEYGGTAGIVTMEDLLEEIVGNIYDEYDEQDEEYTRLDDQTYLFTGTMNLREVQQVLAAQLPVEEYDTISGFVIGQLGRIPTAQEKPEFVYGRYTFAVQEVGQRRIRKVRVTLNEAAG
ncbi:hemolysin family protein [Paenibacillus sp. PK3_47]|uniref:hemolysin family protein n=1 Tax=Paenibacillus sp. PK3_47 TaxID=2072642 RepID=UPI00201E44F4|nr:hemolysin family protein [Paenibacillus sp. PK3_47]